MRTLWRSRTTAWPLSILLAAAGTAALPAAQSQTEFTQTIRPLLKNHCFQCHSGKKQKGNLDLERYVHLSQVVTDLKQWRTIAEVVHEGQMPPKAQPALEDKQRKQITTWLAGVVRDVETAAPTDPGPTLPRRVTRREYRNLVRDLFNVDVDVETYLPSPHSASGYDNQISQLTVSPELLEKYLLLAERVVDAAFPNIYNTRQKEPIKSWFVVWEGEKGVKARAAAEQNLRQLTRLAFRRPPEEKEVAILLKLFDRAFLAKKGFHDSLRFAVKGLLVSPQFLFRVESLPGDEKPARVDDYELASRLSFFLWSSLPDADLLTSAAKGELHKHDVLRRQVKRMCKDPKIRGLAGDFPPQWLFGRLANHQLDSVLFPDYTPALARAASDELATFFEKLLQKNRGIGEMLDSDYTYLNEDLAALYGVKGITGPALRKVTLGDRRRGGLVGMAITMQKTSMPNRTSPTIRGKWVLDSLLGQPPPPPPDDVNNADVDSKKPNEEGKVLSFREKLDLHARTGSACINCHRKIDPIGFSLENFDPLGRYRDKLNGQPVFNTGQLPDGTKLQGIESVKKVLLARQDVFLRNLVQHLLTYALGRDLRSYDLPTIHRITQTVKARQYRLDVLVEEIVMSYPFLNKRATHSVTPMAVPSREKKQ